ncbi:hypothetical protein [Haloarcula salinisoli]|uniref:Uncharacterized protein n=1 Tax=Haloarcula salinisoli TaxID=2487746 RepID=A0A8J8C987_9EURY|nr:hypothetical protein [Halomicroarcula salinisoli]MBX0287344.1 hypothetical protein [Halomicroarcula salinisoli]MBX0305082.1 hypothetical protein [Halomicroarcula salinisoli]
MVDAYKCQNCGDVVESLGSCPSCGENEMRPTRVPESELGTDDEAATSNAAESAGTPTADTGTTADNRTERNGRTASDSGGLLAWLKSLF